MTERRALGPVPQTMVRLTGGFWAERQRLNREMTIPAIYARLQEEGFIEVLDMDAPPRPLVAPINTNGLSMQMFFDSDLGKWIEAASHSLADHPDPALQAQVDDLVGRIRRVQQPDGYLNSWFVRRDPQGRWTNLRDWHEMYSAGHLLEAAVAHHRATGSRAFLDTMARCADHLAARFGPEPGRSRGYDAHPEIELALVRLWRVTGERRYLDLARFFVDQRGTQPAFFDEEARARGEDPRAFRFPGHAYSQAHRPVREQGEVAGHAVRAMYLYAAMADLAREDADPGLLAALDRLWTDLTTRQLYVTGGMGAAHQHEGFTGAYDLPNETAYAETCASVGLVLFAHRMLGLRLDGRYGDAMELALHNGVLAGVSLTGDRFFYDNPLESHGQHRRWRWHECPCCPGNLARLVASLSGYVASAGGRAAALHLYVAARVALPLEGGRLLLAVETDYPWSGEVTLTVEESDGKAAALALRIPGWCPSHRLSVNGREEHALPRDGYVHLDRVWQPGDVIGLSLEMPVERLWAHPAVEADAGRVALQRGPVVYCCEAVDNPAVPQQLRLEAGHVEARRERGPLGEIVALAAPGSLEFTDDWQGTLYRPRPPRREAVAIRFVPYFAWGNRGPGAMAVWMRSSDLPG